MDKSINNNDDFLESDESNDSQLIEQESNFLDFNQSSSTKIEDSKILCAVSPASNDVENSSNINIEISNLIFKNNIQFENRYPVDFNVSFDLALLSMFLSGKITQSCFKTNCDLLKIVINNNYNPPKDFNHCLNRVTNGDFLSYEKSWFCQNCVAYFKDGVDKRKNQCNHCNLKYIF